MESGLYVNIRCIKDPFGTNSTKSFPKGFANQVIPTHFYPPKAYIYIYIWFD